MASLAQLHVELTGLLRQHCPARDQRHLTQLGWMVAGLLLSETVCFDRWKSRLPLGHCLAASWQRRCQRWLSNARIDGEELYEPLILWAIQSWQTPGQALHLALDTTVLWNRFCVVVLSVVAHGRAIPLLWQTLEHPSASVSAAVSIALLEKAERLLAGFGAITLLADRAFPCDELLAWFRGRARWRYVMRLRRGECRGFRAVRLWSYGRRFCFEQLFRDQKSGVFQLADSGLSCPQRLDRLLLVVAIAVLTSGLQGYALSLAGLRRQVDPHWRRGMSVLRIGLAADPRAGAGALHPQPQGQTPRGTGLVLQGGAATTTGSDAAHAPAGCHMNLRLEICRSVMVTTAANVQDLNQQLSCCMGRRRWSTPTPATRA